MKLRTLVLGLVLTVLFATSFVQAQDTAPRTQYPVTVENCGQELTITARPERAIVSWGGQAAYMLALGLDDVIIGMYYRFPDEENRLVPPNLREAYLEIPVIGVDGVPPGREVPISLNPDFFYSDNSSDFADGRATVEDFASIEATVFSSAYGCTDPDLQTLEMMFDEILTLGIIFDAQAEAQAVVAEIEAGLQAVEAQVSGREPVGAVLIEGNSEVLYAAGNGLVQAVFARAGGNNIFDGASYDAPPSREVFATSNPDVILVWDTNVETLPTSFINSVFTASPAVTNQRIVPIRYIGGIGLRVVELADALARAFHPEAFETATAPRTEYPVTIESCGETIVVPQRPQRAVGYWTGQTSIMVGLGAADNVIGRYFFFESDVDVPPPAIADAVFAIPLLGNAGEAPSREAVIAAQPDFYYAGGPNTFPEGQASRADWESIGAVVYNGPSSCAEPEALTIELLYEEITQVGIIFDAQAEAAEIVQGIRDQIAAVQEQIAGRGPVTVVWIDGFSADPIFALGDGYFTDVLRQAGGVNLFVGANYDTPPSLEDYAVSNPDVLLIFSYGETTDELIPRYREVFANSTAVENDQVGTNTYLTSLRTGELVEQVARVLHPEAFE